MEKTQSKKCARCQRELRLGEDALAVTPGVLGHRGFVPLDDEELLCSTECLCRHFQGNHTIPRKIP